jgi:hypothetical protein
MLTPNVFQETKPIRVKLYKDGKVCGQAYLTAHEIKEIETTGYKVRKLA